MALTFDGYTFTGGISPLFFPTNSSHGSIDGVPCSLQSSAGAGISWDPFSIDIPCDCPPQPGDWIEITATTLLFIDITRVTFFLCGGRCTGSFTSPGFSIGLEIKHLKWSV
jgi:hypothetical protein